ncbi:MAG: PEP-CTERM sorting domain-containing protein [Planctomycetota bacterium]
MRIRNIVMNVLVLAPWFCVSAAATPVEFGFSGTVTSVNDPDGCFDSSITTGSAFFGSLSYDPAIVNDQEPGEPTLGDYRPDTPMSARVGSVDFITSGFIAIVGDNQPWDDGMGGSGFRDVFAALNQNAFSSQGIDVFQMSLSLKDNGGTAFDDDGLPTPEDMLAIGDFPDQADFLIAGRNPDDPSQIISISGAVDLLNVTPEPATFALLGAVGLFLARRRR